ncbi:copper chaperone PCu(A)C [Rubellimicrobium aerolatum]|uniref:Copper chaperone PCu(A)C n=1 Tax=Rubellimicrobium aerolatum TaxID=490979 RepID=A0ABW0SDH5_9RHOB|nr:copper chaperone PCu(A)C [Rubellimicrobium aerolatum]MBP1805775.1 copper(I)-binding protein [Rubellimicrobium aerolatum]
MRHHLHAALLALLLPAAPALAGDIGIHDPYALATTPQATTGSAYMMIHNHGDAGDRLLGASSPAAERVELHESREEDGVMRMTPVEGGLPIPADGELELRRGGVHLMLMGLTRPFADGDVIEVTLTFERTGDMTFRVPVDLDRLTGDAPAQGGHGHGHAEPMESHGN